MSPSFARARFRSNHMKAAQIGLSACLSNSSSSKSLSRRRIVPHNFPPQPAPRFVPMLGRARPSFEAKKANEPQRLPVKNNPTNQLFPSSSRSITPPTNNKTISAFFKPLSAPTSNLSASSSSRTVHPGPLLNRSHNARGPAPERDGRAFASLYSGADSFADPVDLTVDASLQKAPIESLIFDSDFSDDDALDLDAPQPLLLPTVLTNTDSTKAEPSPASHTTAISWSQSSPTHYQAQKAAAAQKLPQKSPAKRAPPAFAVSPPKAKKRVLPPSWKTSKDPNPNVYQVESPDTTPAPKARKQLWETTASTIKDQKRQHKNNLKDSAADKDKPETSNEMCNPIKSSTKSNRAKETVIALSKEQRHVKDLVVNKQQSVFFTGPAGTGKSVLMRAIIQELKKKFARESDKLAVTASTGLAACNIGGLTLHSFAGIGLGKEDAATLVKKIRRNAKAKNRWLRTKVLIIDEISMVDGELFDKLSQIGRTVRNNGRPWGGIQLVITGDFFQLPPVPDSNQQAKFAFDAVSWATSIDHTIGLTEVFRQKDPEFAHMLNEMRLGQISQETVNIFKSLSRDLTFDDGLEVTELFPTRDEVDRSNTKRLVGLQGREYTYAAFDTGDPKIRDKMLANMMAPPTLTLKEGAQVMLIKNMDETLVNGSLGTVVDFMTQSTFEIQTGTVADGVGSDDDSFKKRMKSFANALDAAGGSSTSGDKTKYPLVQFHAVDGSQRILQCVPEEWKVETPTGEVTAARKQLPLILAWALSIHKAQGQTLERVKVDLGKVFEKGQAYVALSRATTKHGLQVKNFNKVKVMAHPRVVIFYRNLYSAEQATKGGKA